MVAARRRRRSRRRIGLGCGHLPCRRPRRSPRCADVLFEEYRIDLDSRQLILEPDHDFPTIGGPAEAGIVDDAILLLLEDFDQPPGRSAVASLALRPSPWNGTVMILPPLSRPCRSFYRRERFTTMLCYLKMSVSCVWIQDNYTACRPFEGCQQCIPIRTVHARHLGLIMVRRACRNLTRYVAFDLRRRARHCGSR